jgi:hypothetical protein
LTDLDGCITAAEATLMQFPGARGKISAAVFGAGQVGVVVSNTIVGRAYGPTSAHRSRYGPPATASWRVAAAMATNETQQAQAGAWLNGGSPPTIRRSRRTGRPAEPVRLARPSVNAHFHGWWGEGRGGFLPLGLGPKIRPAPVRASWLTAASNGSWEW